MRVALLTLLLVFSSVTFAKGNCQCPDDKTKNGSRCGKRSSFCKPGGESPSCGTKSEDEKKKLFAEKC